MKKLIIFILLGSLISCSLFYKSRVFKYSEEPFNLIEYSKKNISLLDTSTFYYNGFIGVLPDTRLDTFYNVMKFYTNGTFQFTSHNFFPTESILKNPQSDVMHYYKILDNTLMLEIYAGSMDGLEYWKGNIYNDSIVYYYVNGMKQKLVFIKY